MIQEPISLQSEYYEHVIAKPTHENLVPLAKQAFQDQSHHSYGTDTKTEHVPLAPEVIGHIGSFPITNSLFFSIVVTIFMSTTAIVLSKNISFVPGKFQSIIEVMIEYVSNLGEELAHSRIKAFFPWVMTFFLYILTANLLALFPGVSTIGVYEIHKVNKNSSRCYFQLIQT